MNSKAGAGFRNEDVIVPRHVIMLNPHGNSRKTS